MSFAIPWRDTKIRFVTKFRGNRPLRSSRKVVWFTTHKKTCTLQNSSQPPFCPNWADRAQNYLNVVTPWHVEQSTYTEFGLDDGSAEFCWTYSGKIDFSAQKVITIQAFSLRYDYLRFFHKRHSIPGGINSWKKLLFACQTNGFACF